MKQKLRVFLTLLLCAVASVGWGDDVTFTAGIDKNATTVTKDDITVNMSTMSRDDNYRCYANSDMKIYSVDSKATIKKIEITCTASGTSANGPGNFSYSGSDGKYSYSDKVGTWTGSSTSISLTASAQVRMTKIVVTYTPNGDTPVDQSVTTTTTIDASGITNTDVYTSTAAGQLTANVTVTADGTSIEGATVTWSSSNENVATIATDGTVTLVAAGTTTITASYAGVENEYKASDATYELTVTSSAPYTQPTTIEANLNNALFGTEYTGTASGITDSDPVSGTIDNVTITYAGGGNHYINDSQIRFYPNNKLTFAAPEGYNISSIVFTSDGTWAATISANTGTYTNSTKTWTGTASTVVFTGSGSSRCDMSKATITLASADAVAAPVISGTTPFLGSTEVTITAEEGATIYYTTDDSTPTASSTQYTEPFTLNATTTVKAIAVKDGKTSDVANKEFEKTNSYKLNEISNLAEGKYIFEFENATVTYVNGYYAYIEDSNGAMLYYKNGHGLSAGQVINGFRTVTWTIYSGQPEASAIEGINAVEGSGTPQPTVATIANLLANPSIYMSKFVKLEEVSATETSDGFSVSQDGNEIAFYGRNSAAVENGKTYDIIGFLGKHNENYQFVVYTPDHITEVGVEYSEAPVITVAEGTDGAKVVTITAAEGASIYYTTDGTTPTEESNTYTESLTFTEVGSYIVSAIAVEEGKVASSVVTSEFEIVAPPAPAVINLTEGQSISTTSFPSFSGTGYHTVEAYEITMSDGNAYSWSVSDAMKSGDNLQLKASTGSLTSPEIRTPYGYVVTATYTCGSNVAEMTLTSGEASATGTIVDEELGTHEVSLNVESLAAGFTLSTGNRFAYLQSITITALIAFDEKAGNAPDFAAVYNPNVGANKNVKMLREFGSDYWNTLVVPFDLTRAQLEEAFGEDVKVAKYTGFKTPANIKFETTTEDVTRADMMIVKPAATVTNPIFKGVTLEEGKAYEYPYYESNWADGTLFKITGRFAKQVLTDDDFGKVYFLNKQGQFTHPTADGNLIRGFRWFIQLKTPESSTGAKIALDVDGDVTSIDAIDNGQFATDAIYNLSGQRVNKAQKGIYIVNGKKVVVK